MRRAEASSAPPRAISAIRKASPGSDSASRIAAAISPSSQSLLTGLTDKNLVHVAMIYPLQVQETCVYFDIDARNLKEER